MNSEAQLERLLLLVNRAYRSSEGVMEKLGLIQPPISWHTVRDTIARLAAFFGILCGLLDKIASDVKVMMMTELNEVQEPRGRRSRSIEHDAAEAQPHFLRLHHGV